MNSNTSIKNLTKIGLNYARNLSDTLHQNLGKNDALKNVSAPLLKKIEKSVEFVDDTLGVSEVSKAQEEVTVKETTFLSSRANVEALNFSLKEIQEDLNQIRKKLDRTDRTNENYLSLVADEHQLLLEVTKLKKAHGLAEDHERRNFMEYSSAVRLSHEKERSRVERTKYWSIIGSVSGTVLGFFLSSIVTHHRLKNMKELTIESVKDSTDQINVALNEKFAIISQEIASGVEQQQQQQQQQTQSIDMSEIDIEKFVESKSKNEIDKYNELMKTISSSMSQTDIISKQNKEILALTQYLKEQLQLNVQQNGMMNVVENVADMEPPEKEVKIVENVANIEQPEKEVMIVENVANIEQPEKEVTIVDENLVDIELPQEEVMVVDDKESSIDIAHTSILVLATAAVCIYGYLGNP